MEYGEQQQTNDAVGYYFTQFKTFEQTLEHMEKSWVKIWEAWEQLGSTHMVRYEDLKRAPLAVSAKVLEHLNIDLPRHTVETIVTSYIERPETITKNIHFNKGIVGRYKNVLSSEQILLANHRLKPYLERMGYPQD
jgi:LPS sulfotransferase NodH